MRGSQVRFAVFRCLAVLRLHSMIIVCLQANHCAAAGIQCMLLSCCAHCIGRRSESLASGPCLGCQRPHARSIALLVHYLVRTQELPRLSHACAQVGGRDCDSPLTHSPKAVFVCRSEGTVVTGGDDGDMGAPAEQWYGNDRGGGGGGGRGGGRGEDFNW